jgi:hypothetical protein
MMLCRAGHVTTATRFPSHWKLARYILWMEAYPTMAIQEVEKKRNRVGLSSSREQSVGCQNYTGTVGYHMLVSFRPIA